MADAIDFAIALNVQHGSNYENIELHFGFSREEGNLFNGENPPTVEEFKRRANELGSEVMKDYNVPLVKTQMKKIIVTAKTLYSHPKNVSKIYAALHTDLAW